MPDTVARALYSALLVALWPLVLARLWWRGRREPAYRRHWGERMGRYGRHARAAAGGWLWLHAVSLGETRAAAPLLAELRRREPALRLLLTHGTATGREAGRALLAAGDVQLWLPYDTPGATRRFLRRFRPRVGVLMETEIWPNLLHAAALEGVPVLLANARLSERSARKARRLDALMHPAAARLDAVLAQSAADAGRFVAAGARRVEVAGNLKFDMTPDAAGVARGAAWRARVARHAGRHVVLAASTREGEEAPLLDAWRRRPAPRPLLVVVPRHPQRFDAVAALVEGAGFTLTRRSGWGEAPPDAALSCDVWLGDSLGEMALYYGSADVALLGGSWAPLGGQNLIEAAACGCPLVMGPHVFNFAEAARLALQAGAAEQAADVEAGVDRALALAADPDADARRQRALAFAQAHRGATARMAGRIVERWGGAGAAGAPGASSGPSA